MLKPYKAKGKTPSPPHEGKGFKDGFTCSGMRWSRIGAEWLLPFRGSIMGHRFDERWKTAYNCP